MYDLMVHISLQSFKCIFNLKWLNGFWNAQWYHVVTSCKSEGCKRVISLPAEEGCCQSVESGCPCPAGGFWGLC